MVAPAAVPSAAASISPVAAPAPPTSTPLVLAPSSSSSAITDSAFPTIVDAATEEGDGEWEIPLLLRQTSPATSSPAFDSASSSLDAAEYTIASAESEDPPRGDHVLASSCRVTLDAAATAAFPIQIPEREGNLKAMEVGAKIYPTTGIERAYEFLDSGLAAPHRAPPCPPRPRHPRRACLRVHRLRQLRRAPPSPPHPRRLRRAALRPPWLCIPRRAPPRRHGRRAWRHPPRPPWRAPPCAPRPQHSLSCTTTRTPLHPPPTSCSTPCPATATTPITTLMSWLTAQPEALACSPLTVDCVEEATSTESAVRCSVQSLSCNVDELKPVDTIIWAASTTSLLFTAEIPRDIIHYFSLKHFPRRYIIPVTSAFSVGVVLFVAAINIPGSSLVAIKQPPDLHSLLHQHFIFGNMNHIVGQGLMMVLIHKYDMVGYCWALLQFDNLHTDCASQSFWMLCSYFLKDNIALLTDDAQLRPLPWPSFTNTVVVDSLSSIWSLVEPVLSDVADLSLWFSCYESKCTPISAFSMQYNNQFSGISDNALQVSGLIRIVTVVSTPSFQGTMLYAFGTSKGVFEYHEYRVALAIFLSHVLMVRRTILLVSVQKSWSLLHGYKRHVVLHLSVLHHVVCCKVPWPAPPIFVSMVSNGLAGAAVSFSRRLLLQCYPYGLQAVLHWSDTHVLTKGPEPSILIVELVGIPPKPPWSFLCLEQDGFKSKSAIQPTHTLGSCWWSGKMLLINGFLLEISPWCREYEVFVQLKIAWLSSMKSKVAFRSVELRPSPWPSFCFYPSAVLQLSSWLPPVYRCRKPPVQNEFASSRVKITEEGMPSIDTTCMTHLDKDEKYIANLNDSVKQMQMLVDDLWKWSSSPERVNLVTATYLDLEALYCKVSQLKLKADELLKVSDQASFMNNIIALQAAEGQQTLQPLQLQDCVQSSVCVQMSWDPGGVTYCLSPQEAMLNAFLLKIKTTRMLQIIQAQVHHSTEQAMEGRALRWRTGELRQAADKAWAPEGSSRRALEEVAGGWKAAALGVARNVQTCTRP